MQILEDNLLRLYRASFKSKDSATKYIYLLNSYAKKDLSSLLSLTQKEAEDKLIDYIIREKDAGRSWGSLHNYVAAIAKFYLINDFNFNTKRVKRFMPEHTRLKKDRAYHPEEIQSLLEIANERSRAIILLLSSSGMRLGGIVGLRKSDLTDMGEYYKITVYTNSNQEYFTYCTPEARKALDTYFEIRKRHGEKLNQDSPVIREQYDREDLLRARQPKFSTPRAVSKAIEEILLKSGIRVKQPRTEKANAIYKKEISLCHGFRKFFNTQLANTEINPLIKELLMGHEVGLEENYYRPTEEIIQAEYEKGIDALTIDPSKRLQRKVEMLTVEKSKIDLALSEIAEMKKTLRL